MLAGMGIHVFAGSRLKLKHCPCLTAPPAGAYKLRPAAGASPIGKETNVIWIGTMVLDLRAIAQESNLTPNGGRDSDPVRIFGRPVTM